MIVQLKKAVCEKATEGREIRKQIEALTWKEGSLPEVQAIRSKRDASGHCVAGKRALKEFRRPETGPERFDLWNQKRWAGWEARTALLAYGLVRGRAYKTIEASCAPGNEPSSYNILKLLEGILPSGKVTEAVIKEWLKGGPAPALIEKEKAA